MTTVTGIRFREVGKIYYFDPGELTLRPGDNVIVDTVRGTEFGTVMIGNMQVEDEEIVQPLKVVRRRATADDVERVHSNREKEKDAFTICKQKIRERGLEMKLISAEYTFDNAKILFYFTADGRVDFRELVKDLAAIFRIRIELRQVGVRDETKLMGGLGGCGRPLCCASYLSDFVPVSIRMAKEQNLSLNPQKISGVCGRLMCCLKNEADTYEDLNTRLPKEGGRVITADGREGIAETVNVLRERVRVLFTDEQGNREMEEFPAGELQFTPRRKPKPCECRAASRAAAEDYDTEELAAEAMDETDPDLKALAAAEMNDAMEERDADEADANVVGEKKRRRHRRRKPSDDGQPSAQPEKTSQLRQPRMTRDESEGSDTPAKTDNNETEGTDAQADGSRRRRRHRKPSDEGQSARSEKSGQSGQEQETRNEKEGQTRPPRRRRHTDNQQVHGNNGDGNGSVNSAADSPKDSGADSAANAENGQGGNNNAASGDNRHNGAYRRFRKRRPKNNPES